MGAGNETDSIHIVSCSWFIVPIYYVSLCTNRFNLFGKGSSKMSKKQCKKQCKYILYLKNAKGVYEPTAIGYFKDLVPLAFGHTAWIKSLGKEE